MFASCIVDIICEHKKMYTAILVSSLSAESCHLCQDNHLNTILGGILNRAHNKVVTEDELTSLQTILVKLLSYFKGAEDVFALV